MPRLSPKVEGFLYFLPLVVAVLFLFLYPLLYAVYISFTNMGLLHPYSGTASSASSSTG